MKVAVKQPSESMPNVLNDDDDEAELPENPTGPSHDEADELLDEGEDGPLTVPADVCCIVPGCGRRHGRMCTFPVEGEMRTAWTSVLEAVFPEIDVNAPEPKLKLLCEDHFEPADFDDKGLIQPLAVPTRFPGGVKVIYNRDGEEGEEAPPPPPPSNQPPITCCVPGCMTTGPADTMFAFPVDHHRAWTSIISAATNKNNWRKGEMDPNTKRPLDLRVCNEHFAPECLIGPENRKRLKEGSHPSLFEGGKKKVILRPSSKAPAPETPQPKPKPKPPPQPLPKKTPVKPRADPVKKMGPVYVNVTEDGLQLLFKNGNALELSDLTLSELRRIRDCIKDKLLTDVAADEKRNLELSMTQVKPVLEKLELQEAQNPEASPVLLDVMALDPDLSDADVRKLVDNIKQVDCQRREYERSLSRYFEDSDGFARELEGYQGKITSMRRKISNLESTYLRFFKFSDQRKALMGARTVRWSIPTLTLARDIIQKIGKTAYARVMRMGFPLPSAEIVSRSMENAHAQNSTAGLVEITEDRDGDDDDGGDGDGGDGDGDGDGDGGGSTDTAADGDSGDPAERLQNGDAVEDTEEPAPKKAKTSDNTEASEEAAHGALRSITAEHLQNVLAGKGRLEDSHGRTIKVTLAEVPGAPPGAKTVVMETPDDAGEVRYVSMEETEE